MLASNNTIHLVFLFIMASCTSIIVAHVLGHVKCSHMYFMNSQFVRNTQTISISSYASIESPSGNHIVNVCYRDAPLANCQPWHELGQECPSVQIPEIVIPWVRVRGSAAQKIPW